MSVNDSIVWFIADLAPANGPRARFPSSCDPPPTERSGSPSPPISPCASPSVPSFLPAMCYSTLWASAGACVHHPEGQCLDTGPYKA